MTRSLHDALEETLGFVQRALDRIRAGDNAEAELHKCARLSGQHPRVS